MSRIVRIDLMKGVWLGVIGRVEDKLRGPELDGCAVTESADGTIALVRGSVRTELRPPIVAAVERVETVSSLGAPDASGGPEIPPGSATMAGTGDDLQKQTGATGARGKRRKV